MVWLSGYGDIQSKVGLSDLEGNFQAMILCPPSPPYNGEMLPPTSGLQDRGAQTGRTALLSSSLTQKGHNYQV